MPLARARIVGFADVELFNVELFVAKNKGKAGMIE